ncbi:DNA sulfur modification protein DndB [Pontiellaceae bacterium B1224]|nr:DNA sulfur modification protein DndB [Pontiellaceae bacterium B1224]
MSNEHSFEYEYVFPSIRGVQAQQEYYISMCPIRLIPRMFMFDEPGIPPELRAQRTLNQARIPEIKRYILDNLNNYVFSAITASIDGEAKFEPYGGDKHRNKMGNLHIDMSAKLIINDGQHRRAAIEEAIMENPDIANETLAVVFFLDPGLKRCQQMFADLNRYAIRPSKSLGILYDYRDDFSILTKEIVARSELFRSVVEMERSSLSARSRKLFTLSAIYSANKALLKGATDSGEDQINFAVDFWECTAKQLKEWNLVFEHKLSAGETRSDYVHSHSTALQAIGMTGNTLIKIHPNNWKSQLKKLRKIDWARSNSTAWEGRTMVGGMIQKASNNIVLTANYIKANLDLELTQEEQKAEEAFMRGHNGN